MPAFGEKAIDRIGREDVLGVLVPIWTTKPEYPRKLRQPLRVIRDWAVAHGYVSQKVPLSPDVPRTACTRFTPFLDLQRLRLHCMTIGSPTTDIWNP